MKRRLSSEGHFGYECYIADPYVIFLQTHTYLVVFGDLFFKIERSMIY